MSLEIPVHPRVGGEHTLSMSRFMWRYGSSPRGRGTRFEAQAAQASKRFIPAWAGNTRPKEVRYGATSVHPRVGGEHPSKLTKKEREYGSSPRGRGTQCLDPLELVRERFIPAWAGNTRFKARPFAPSPVHPRVGGEHRYVISDEYWERGSSPRGRGTRRPAGRCQATHRFIPAWAGNTLSWAMQSMASAVHPRVGGEHRDEFHCSFIEIGSSPRGRGTHPVVFPAEFHRRFIPAWAGNTYCPFMTMV